MKVGRRRELSDIAAMLRARGVAIREDELDGRLLSACFNHDDAESVLVAMARLGMLGDDLFVSLSGPLLDRVMWGRLNPLPDDVVREVEQLRSPEGSIRSRRERRRKLQRAILTGEAHLWNNDVVINDYRCPSCNEIRPDLSQWVFKSRLRRGMNPICRSCYKTTCKDVPLVAQCEQCGLRKPREKFPLRYMKSGAVGLLCRRCAVKRIASLPACVCPVCCRARDARRWTAGKLMCDLCLKEKT